MYHFFSASKFRMSKTISSKNELTQLVLEIDTPSSYNPALKKFEKGSVNGVSVSKVYQEEKPVLVIKLEATSSLAEVDTEFRTLISKLEGLDLKEKDQIITQYVMCLKQHDLYTPDKSNHHHDSSGSANYAF